jgi:hypothetical protein
MTLMAILGSNLLRRKQRQQFLKGCQYNVNSLCSWGF